MDNAPQAQLTHERNIIVLDKRPYLRCTFTIKEWTIPAQYREAAGGQLSTSPTLIKLEAIKQTPPYNSEEPAFWALGLQSDAFVQFEPGPELESYLAHREANRKAANHFIQWRVRQRRTDHKDQNSNQK